MTQKECLYAKIRRQLLLCPGDWQDFIETECYNCRHSEQHNQDTDCFIKCCDVHDKNVRCVSIE